MTTPAQNITESKNTKSLPQPQDHPQGNLTKAEQNKNSKNKASKKIKKKVKPKSERLFVLLEREQGATVAELEKTSGWQTHTIRAFLSRNVRKKYGEPVQSEVGKDGKRRYRVQVRGE